MRARRGRVHALQSGAMHADPAHAATSPASAARSASATLRRAWPALPAAAVAVFVLLRLGFDDGGYFPAAYTSAGAIAFIALAVLVVRPARQRLRTHALVAIGALAGVRLLGRAVAHVVGRARTCRCSTCAARCSTSRCSGSGCSPPTPGVTRACSCGRCSASIVAICGAGLLSRLQPDLVTLGDRPVRRRLLPAGPSARVLERVRRAGVARRRARARARRRRRAAT